MLSSDLDSAEDTAVRAPNDAEREEQEEEEEEDEEEDSPTESDVPEEVSVDIPAIHYVIFKQKLKNMKNKRWE